VKTLRLCFLLLLAALLPLRGAVAAAMLCPPAGVGTSAEAGVSTSAEVLAMGLATGHAMDHHAAADATAASHADGSHGPGSHDGSSQAHASHDQGAPDKCNLCAAFCSLTPMLGSPPTLPPSLPAATTAFPALSAPVPIFLSDGQDRPPRSR